MAVCPDGKWGDIGDLTCKGCYQTCLTCNLGSNVDCDICLEDRVFSGPGSDECLCLNNTYDNLPTDDIC